LANRRTLLYFQAQKFAGTEAEERVARAYSPKQAAELGRSRALPLRSDWELVKDEIMHSAVKRKFETHKDIRAILLGTGEEDLVENAPGDYYWGCGADGSGKNKLGQILMRSGQN
jgi:N-glycosidase YbiA